MIKLSTVASDIFGKSGRAMLEALIAGERDPEVLADMALGQMRKKTAALKEALTGRFDAHHAELARMLLDEIDALSEKIERLTCRVSTAIRNSPQAVMDFPRGRPREVPRDGHWNSPGTATRTPRGRPRCGLGSVVERLHPLARGGVGQAHGLSFGDDHMGMVKEPVHER